MEAALPSPEAGLRFDLELRGASGQRLTVKDVLLLEPTQSKKEEGGR
jgi:hypothetical protein